MICPTSGCRSQVMAMRQLLLDTHVALWAFASPELLRPEVRSALTDPLNTVMVSAHLDMEVEIARLGTLDAPQGFAALHRPRL